MENSSDDFWNVWVEFPDSCNGLYQVYIYILWISLIEFVAHKWAGAHIYTQGPYNAKLWLPWRPHRRSSSHAPMWLLERRKSLKERILVAYMENYSRIIAWLATKHTHSTRTYKQRVDFWRDMPKVLHMLTVAFPWLQQCTFTCFTLLLQKCVQKSAKMVAHNVAKLGQKLIMKCGIV